jgi:hypothetical protein
MAAVVIVSPLRASDSWVWWPSTSRRCAIAVLISGKVALVEWVDGEAGDGGRRFVVSEAVEEYRESCQGGTDNADVARVVAVAGGQSDVIERRQRVAVFGLKLR